MGFNQVDHPQLDYLRPAQHCGFRLERCQTPENALIGRIGKAYEDVAIPFRDLEDAVHLGGLIGALERGARCTTKASGPEIEEEVALALGDLAGIFTAMQAVYLPVLEALETWDLGSDELSLGILSIHDLARRYIEVLGEICVTSDEHTQRILRDIDRYLDMARKARGRRKSRLGTSYFITEKAIFGKHVE
jgi:hypothetical protein